MDTSKGKDVVTILHQLDIENIGDPGVSVTNGPCFLIGYTAKGIADDGSRYISIMKLLPFLNELSILKHLLTILAGQHMC